MGEAKNIYFTCLKLSYRSKLSKLQRRDVFPNLDPALSLESCSNYCRKWGISQEVFRFCGFQLQSLGSWRFRWNWTTFGASFEESPRHYTPHSLRYCQYSGSGDGFVSYWDSSQSQRIHRRRAVGRCRRRL